MTPMRGLVTVDIDSAPPSSARTGPRRDRAETVRRLRRQGWSYRRISAEVGLPYREVSRLLDAPEITVGLTPTVRLPPPPPVTPATARPPGASAMAPPMASLVSSSSPSPAVAALARAKPPAARGTEPPAAPAAAILAEDARTLHHKLDQVLRNGEEQRRALERLAQDVAAVRTEQQAMGRRLQDLFTALWQRLTGRRGPSEPESPA